jgi:hypothetical protein
MRTLFRTLAVGVLVAATGFAAVPAQAASFGFNWSLTNDDFRHRQERRQCFMTDYQIRQAVRREGFTNIKLAVENNNRIQVTATNEDGVYKLDFDTCKKRIIGGRLFR